MTRCLLVLMGLLITSLSFSQSEVYKTVDDRGNVIYSDKPSANAVKIKVAEPIIVPAILPEKRTIKLSPPTAPTHYEVSVTYPTAEMHVTAGTSHLPVQVSTNPPVHKSHKLVILDNGEAIQDTVIEYIIRGTHSIQAQVVNERGKVLGSSGVITIYVHRPSLNSPRGPSQNDQ